MRNMFSATIVGCALAASACGGAPSGECERVRTDLDVDADGVVDEVQTMSYDGDGNLTRAERYVGAAPRGNPIRRTNYSYDDDDNISRVEIDQPLDGQADAIVTYAYEEGRQTRETFDTDADGERDQVTHFEYDGGDRTKETTDTDLDGEADAITALSYLDDGKLEQTENDADADGEADARITYHYEDDRRSRHDRDNDADGTVDEVLTYEYDGDNVRRRLLYDGSEPEGDPKRTWSYRYECPPR